MLQVVGLKNLACVHVATYIVVGIKQVMYQLSSLRQLNWRSHIVIMFVYSAFSLPESDTEKLKCNTEKDRHGHLNHRTAGNTTCCVVYVVCSVCAQSSCTYIY